MPTDTVTVDLEIDTAPFIKAIARARLEAHLLDCKVCRHYVKRRGHTLMVAAAVQAMVHDVDVNILLTQYVTKAVHDRHLAGQSLSTRRSTPPRQDGTATTVTVQRGCNGCGKQLGDAQPDELEAAVERGPLPDVRLECGCWIKDVAA